MECGASAFIKDHANSHGRTTRAEGSTLEHCSTRKDYILGHYCILMDAIDFNPWWETGAIDSETSSLKRRDIYPKLKETLEERFVETIIGLRRVGKTVLMHQLIGHLLNTGIDAKRIFYFSFDIERKDLNKIIKEYEEKILHDRIKGGRVFLFFDENTS